MPCVLTNILLPRTGNDVSPGALAFRDGRIVASDDACPSGWPTVDGRGLLALPGALDPHVHFDDPGYTWREDFAHGSRSALAGGVTCVFDMPDTAVPPVTDCRTLAAKQSVVMGQAYCDAGFWAGLSAQALSDPAWRQNMDALWAGGVIGFKLYVLSGMETFTQLSYRRIKDVLTHAAALGALVGVHAEDADTVARARASSGDCRGTNAYLDSRPVEAEVTAIRRLGELAGECSARLHIVHLSSGSGAEEIARLQRAGVDISCETCAQYLAFNDEDFGRLGSVLKCAPPVRTNAERALLREHLGSTVTMLASDHAPCPRAEKETGDIFTDYGGMPGVQLLLPYALHLALAEQLITLEQLVRLTSAAAAERFGVDNRKGGVAPGLDADVVLVDPEENWRVEGKRLHSKGSLTPFEGHTLRGRVIETWLRGQRAWDGSGFAVPSGLHIKRKGA